MNAVERREALTRKYVARNTGRVVCADGTFGCESPDLATDYLRHVTGKDIAPVGDAVDWQPHRSAGRELQAVARWHPNPEDLEGKAAAALHGDTPCPGDVLVYGPGPGWGLRGTLGICLQVLPGASVVAECFTQGTQPAGPMTIATMPLLGWWRVRDEYLRSY